MKIAILGYGDQGRSAYDYWQAANNITICDKNTDVGLPEHAIGQLGEAYLKNLDRFDLLVRSPGVHPRDIMAANSPAILRKVTTVTNEFFKVCPTRNIIGVTGTKGKGTTCTLIAKMLEADGRRVHLGGNIGTPPLDLLRKDIQPDDWVVLELANFQLIDLKVSPAIAVCLMMTPEHLDWHTDEHDYYASKKQLFEHQTSENIAIYNGQNEVSQQIASVGDGQKIPYLNQPGAFIEDDRVKIAGQTICTTDEIKLLGKHNWENVCAAVTAAWQITKNVEAMRSVITSFTGLPHRLELVRELDGVKYYDDSFGTTPETAIVALQALPEPKVIILGGYDKGSDFNELAEVVSKTNIRHAVLIGNTTKPGFKTATPAIETALKTHGFAQITSLIKPGGPNINEVVQAARAAARPGDAVLLSTACASFDIFNNYKERGEQFAKAVRELA